MKFDVFFAKVRSSNKSCSEPTATAQAISRKSAHFSCVAWWKQLQLLTMGRQRQRRSKAERATAQTVPSSRTCERRDGLVREKAPHLERL